MAPSATTISWNFVGDYRSLGFAGGLDLREFGSVAPLALEWRFIIGRLGRWYGQLLERNSPPERGSQSPDFALQARIVLAGRLQRTFDNSALHAFALKRRT